MAHQLAAVPSSLADIMRSRGYNSNPPPVHPDHMGRISILPVVSKYLPANRNRVTFTIEGKKMEAYLLPAVFLVILLQELRILIKRQKIRKIMKQLKSMTKEKEEERYKNRQLLSFYQRFAPRGLSKEEAEQQGIVGLMTLQKDDSKNITIEHLCQSQSEGKGILLPDKLDLTAFRILFTGEPEQALQFGIDTIGGLKDKNGVSILLHETEFRYGITGTATQAYPYVISPEADALQNCFRRLKEASVKLAVTFPIPAEVGSRYIGYAVPREHRINLYEVIDACPEPERSQKLRADEDFQNGLRMYYENDFYLARSYFAKVMRVCAKDDIAKWYIFSCERLINETHDETRDYGLFADECGGVK